MMSSVCNTLKVSHTSRESDVPMLWKGAWQAWLAVLRTAVNGRNGRVSTTFVNKVQKDLVI
jgi:hypothetical protein